MGAPGSTGRAGAAHSSSKLWTESLKGYRIREGSTEKEREREQSLTERDREKGQRNKRGESMINIFIKPSHVPRVLYL